MIPSLFIHNEYTAEIVANSLKRQKLVIKKINKDKSMYGKSNIDPHAFLILDDCLYDQSWVRDENIRNLFMNGRHYKILFYHYYAVCFGSSTKFKNKYRFCFYIERKLCIK